MERRGDEYLKTAKFLFFFLVLFYSISLNMSLVLGTVPPVLNLTIITDKSTYVQRESIAINGALSLGVNPLTNWPVAISITSPNGTLLFHTTMVTDHDGNFVKTINLMPHTEVGAYSLLASVQWSNQNSMRTVSFEIKSTGQVGVVPSQIHLTPPPSSSILLTQIAAIVSFCLITLALVFNWLATSQKKEKTSAAPVTPIPSVKKARVNRYKICAECGETFSGIRTFCPRCFTYHGKDRF
ncbi:MAG: hypothetical protein OEZ29_00855 [Candidatus Bathyarchaeota archaeon]|nr:hypothetical protein [Candidatus Bathyarchaeota archaeon]MDH5779125.1 hypothetical protein [Candidatus Bathyarchaeota archaeon]